MKTLQWIAFLSVGLFFASCGPDITVTFVPEEQGAVLLQEMVPTTKGGTPGA